MERRMRRAIIQELEQKGWRKDGGLMADGKGKGLGGALLVVLEKDASVALTARREEVKVAAEWVVRNVVRLGREAKTRGTGKARSGRSEEREAVRQFDRDD